MNVQDRLIQLCNYHKASDIVISNIKSHYFNTNNISTIYMSNEKCYNCNILIEDIIKKIIELLYNIPGAEILSCNEVIIKSLLE